MLTWIIVAVIILIIVIRVLYELRHPKITTYEMCSEKLPEEFGCRLVFLSDLHLRKYGEHNEILVSMIAEQKPDVILIGGDMTVKKGYPDENSLYALLRELAKLAPVYYAPGNHESFIKEKMREAIARREEEAAENGNFETGEEFRIYRYERLIAKCKEYGIRYLSNKTAVLPFDQGADIAVKGLDLPYEFYDKKVRRKLKEEEIEELLGAADLSKYNIMLAHPPAYFEAYVKYGADLVLAGHYHGGAVRFGKAGLVSPQVRFFPKYSAGRFEKDGTTMIVTRGIGSHSVNLRLFNYPEVVVINLTGSDRHSGR